MTIGKDPDEIDDETPDQDVVAEALGFDAIATDSTPTESETSTADRDVDVAIDTDAADELPSKEDLWAVIQTQQKTIDALKQTVESLERTVADQTRDNERLRERVADLEKEKEKAEESRANLWKQLNESRDEATEAKEIAKSASVRAYEAKDVAEGNETESEAAPQLPNGVKPSSSPLDFFANCNIHKAKKHFVDEQGKKNTYRALLLALRWEEFATKRKDGSGVFWTRENIQEGLTAIQGKKPHPQTVSRVWRALDELGSADVEERQRRVSAKQEPTDILAMDMDTAEGLLENRYAHLDLLEESKVSAGGVTPVVTQSATAEV